MQNTNLLCKNIISGHSLLCSKSGMSSVLA